MKNLSYITAIFAIIFLAAFTNKESTESIDITYSFTQSESSEASIILQLNPDNTFVYKNHTRPDKPVDVQGKYTLKKGKVKLYDFESEYSIATNWVITDEYPCIRSRNVLNFTRICEQ